MPRPYTFPTLYDDALRINISKLKEWRCLEPNNHKKGTLTWSVRGNQTGCIDIIINTSKRSPYIELDYKYGDQPRNYKVQLVSVPSNLGKGRVWYFLCPQTGKRCRILYSIGGYFLHREAFRGCMYETQRYSQKDRTLIRVLDNHLANEKIYDEIYSKHFKTYYAGKPTRRYLKLMKKLEKAQSYKLSMQEFNGLFHSIVPKRFE